MRSTARAVALIFCASMITAGCGQEQDTAPPEIVRPVETFVIPEPETGGIRRFSARVEAQNRADVSFRVPGKIMDLLVVEGDRVDKGAVIARLDPTEYQLVVDDRAATLYRAERDYQRAKPLAEKEIVTMRELDRREAAMKSAQANLNLAQQNLDYTILKAPFAGQISKRYVQRFEEVVAKQKIMELKDLNALEIKFDVPEQIMLRVRETASARGEARAQPRLLVSFDAAPGKEFDLEFKEVATRADPATRTFEATYTMPVPNDLTVLPGMTATVTAHLGKYLGSQSVTYVPVEAVVASDDLAGQVWVVDVTSMTVGPKPVEVGALRGGQIAVREGLEPGDRVVVAGAPFLVPGMKVSLKQSSTPNTAPN